MKMSNWLAAAMLFAIGGPAWAATGNDEPKPPAFAEELIHSDVPLWGTGDNFYPQHFTSGDEFGCVSRTPYGDWKLTQTNDTEDRHSRWMRLRNYGAFHCAIVESTAYNRENLAGTGYRYSFFIKIAKTKIAGKDIELWALQSGTTPGSDYLLLARSATDSELIKSFDILQRECPVHNLRTGPDIDVWPTRYCSINSQRKLAALARSMAQKPSLGKLTYVGAPLDEPDEDMGEAVAEAVIESDC